ncbi:alpha 1,2-mannosyltransferase 2.4.1 [Podila epicladia]|nr:alpha 1,2-mannosyltransferase 2.4.1 [Podila epicladia]
MRSHSICLLLIAFILGFMSRSVLDWSHQHTPSSPSTSTQSHQQKQHHHHRPSSSPSSDSSHFTTNNSLINDNDKPALEPDVAKDRVNAAFVVLLQNKDLHEMRKTMRLLEQTFNHRHGYPYVFLNNIPFTDHFKTHIQAMTKAKVHFGLIPREQWSYPSFINQTQAAINREDMKARKVAYGGSESYRHMCRYESGFFFRHELVQQFDYYWRVEPGVSFSCDLDFDPFLVMKTKKLKYGFTIALPEYVGTIPTLWDNVKKFKEQHPEHIATKNSLNWISYDHGDTYNNCHFWSNFEIADLSFFRSKAYLDFFEMLDKTGGFFYERWGDAPVHSIAAALMLERKEIHFFNEIGYRHGMYEHCPESPALQLKCSCDPADNVDWKQYSCLRRFLET